MFVRQYGNGANACFCLHGWSGDHRTFEPLAEVLPADGRLYAADLPGCGLSPAPEQWDLRSVTREIVQALQETDAANVTLVGNCIGALFGMCAALETTVVKRMILIDTFAMWPWYFRVFTTPGVGDRAYAATFGNPVGRWITNRALAGKRAEGSDLTKGFAGARHEAQLKYLRIAREIKSPQEFAALHLPVDVVFGSRTFRAVRESALLWQEVWPLTRIRELESTGHLVLQEAAGLVSDIIFGGDAWRVESQNTSNCTRS